MFGPKFETQLRQKTKINVQCRSTIPASLDFFGGGALKIVSFSASLARFVPANGRPGPSIFRNGFCETQVATSDSVKGRRTESAGVIRRGL